MKSLNNKKWKLYDFEHWECQDCGCHTNNPEKHVCDTFMKALWGGKLNELVPTQGRESK